MATMNTRRAPVIATAASTLVGLAVLSTTFLMNRPVALEAVPAPDALVSVPADAVDNRTPAPARDEERPDLSGVASDRLKAQADLASSIGSRDRELTAAQRARRAAADQKLLKEALAEAKEAKRAAEQAERRAAEAKKAAAKKAAEATTVSTDVASVKKVARAIASSTYGWGDSEFACYDRIITQESGWNYTATNPSSGAYGIPQALPASKMASAGSDWRTNPATQVKWGLSYVKGRYGTPCQAWSFKSSHGWY